jgi:lipid-A-disaccharide synthase
MIEAGLRPVVHAQDLMVMGFGEILLHLPRIFRALSRVAHAAAVSKPDLAIVIDYPDFHFRLAKKLHKLGIPVIYYIPPKVWAWRKSRVRLLQKYFIKILSIFPFESEFYRGEGIPVQYVGNPLVDELPLQLTTLQARQQLSLDPAGQVVVLMPGSRPAELKRHFDLMLEAAGSAAEILKQRHSAFQKLQVLMPFPAGASLDQAKAKLELWLQARSRHSAENLIEVRLSQGDAHRCLVAADAGLIKSGTSTLEAGVLKCAHAVVYKPNALTAWIFKYLIRYRGPVGLVNLVAGWKPGQDSRSSSQVTEFLCGDATVDVLAQELVELLTHAERRIQMQAYFEKVRQALGITESNEAPQSPSLLGAREVLQVLRERGIPC